MCNVQFLRMTITSMSYKKKKDYYPIECKINIKLCIRLQAKRENQRTKTVKMKNDK